MNITSHFPIIQQGVGDEKTGNLLCNDAVHGFNILQNSFCHKQHSAC